MSHDLEDSGFTYFLFKTWEIDIIKENGEDTHQDIEIIERR